MANETIWGAELVSENWFSPETQAEGWFDSELLDLTLPPPSSGLIKVWNGSWAGKPIKYWSGSSWTTKPIKSWNGSAWV
jgi:hypothetical protein